MGRNAKRSISLFLIIMLVFPSSGFTLTAQAASADIPVLLYHRIIENPSNEWTDTSIEKFEQTMQYLHDHDYQTLSAEQYVKIQDGTEAPPEKSILLTFDDATPDFITNVLPILKKYDMQAVLFVVSDWINGDYSMSEAQLKSLVDEPSISIQNHSKRHTEEGVWTNNITLEQANEEIAAANTYLKAITNQDPVLMAYPYGAYNEHAEQANQENGIKYAFKAGQPNGGNFAMGRYYIKTDTSVADIADWIGGPAPEEQTDQETTAVFHETFADGKGAAVQAGNATLASKSELVYDGNEDGKSILISDRTNNWDGVDLPFDNLNMENGKTYTITVKGYIDTDVTVPEGAQAYLQNIDSYDWTVGDDLVAGEPFHLTGQYTVNTSKDSALRIQSNDAGATVPFYIGDVLITSEEADPEQPSAQGLAPITFEDETFGGFEGRSGTETLTVTDEANHTDNGVFALKVEDRTETWHGPFLPVAEYVEQGKEYTISAWVKLISPDSSELQLSTQVGEGDNASYNSIQSKTVSKADGWVQLEGTYRYNSLGDGSITIYIESSNNATASFYVDDISFEPTESDEVEIEKRLTPIKEIYQDDFLIGNAVSATEFEGTRLELLKHHHNLVTAENAMKPGAAYNDQEEFDFSAEDALVQKAQEQGFNIHGHVLVWHQQSLESLHTDENGDPLSREKALTNLRNHVKTSVEHFGTNVISWDVVNEAMNDNPPNPSDWKASLRQSGWYKAIGPDYIEQAFRAAKEVIDKNDWNIKLYYNDYNDDNQNKAEAIYQMAKELNANYAAENNGELLIDGIGMQAHYNLNTNPENVRRSMEKFISLGVEVGVTELDVTGGSNNEQTEQEANEQAYLYAQLFQLYKEHADSISRVTFWGLNDSTSWRAEQSPLLFDENLQAKPAYYAIADPETFIENYDPVEKDARQGEATFGTPVVDGTLDDIWDSAAELPVDRFQMAWQGANGVAKTLWDQDHLYVLVQVSDAQPDKSSENPWEQDSVEVFIDENNGKTAFYEKDDGQYRVNFDNETSFNPTSIAEGFESATHVSDNGYMVEMKIPLRHISPANKQKIGFDVQINDGADGARQSAATWNDTTGAGFQDTSVFGELTLIDTSEPDPEDPEDPKDPEKPEKQTRVTVTPDVTNGEAAIETDSLDPLADQGELLIDLGEHNDSISLAFTSEQIKWLKEHHITLIIQLKNVSLQLAAANFTNGSDAATIQLDRLADVDQALSVVYDFKIKQSDKQIDTFEEKVTLSFSVDSDKINNKDQLQLFHWNPETEEWEAIGGEWQDGNVTAQTGHFSTYTVFEQEAKEQQPVTDDGQTLPDTATSTYQYLLAGVLFFLGGVFFLFMRRRKA
ncbi:endo-1,4-beta-xylanase [Gracilibacillus caseinilyticus]|uniref:Beta-xylanase n=1 Tax=Gracilibacillus caseinilyticus TaxID=2932256 RepID=A0ABY4F023_9BACI|nr:endo-1,4-beta-xylanase [Gracilibacillus caseinilyticus]UOQ49858.1 endo-1,4-beta-xylanase [Gracilibacillus caseinilyticus]